MKVLLVDDEEKFVSALAKRLLIRGIDAEWTTTIDEALFEIELETYDLAVLDVKMPGMNGIELKRKMEKINPKLKFILVTGHGSDEDFYMGSKEVFCYIIKPFKIEALVEKINQAMSEKE
ncbi:MAG: response regulator [Pseudomonadota bacterium]